MKNEKIIETIDFEKYNVTFHKGESGLWQCPICGEFVFEDPIDNDYCPVCDAPNDEFYYALLKIETDVTPDEARKQWKEKGKIDWNWK